MILPSASRRLPADRSGPCRRMRCPTASYTTLGDTIPEIDLVRLFAVFQLGFLIVSILLHERFQGTLDSLARFIGHKAGSQTPQAQHLPLEVDDVSDKDPFQTVRRLNAFIDIDKQLVVG